MKPNVTLQLCVLLLTLPVANAAGEEAPRKGGSRHPIQQSACNDVPAHAFDVILGRPTRDGVTASVLANQDTEGYVAYGAQRDALTRQTPPRVFRKGEPQEIVLAGLQPDSRYYYQLRLAQTNGAERSFHTARAPGSAFVFTVTADSHLDENTEPLLYRQTLANALADGPDFHIDLGDTFMTEKHRSRESAAQQYLAQRDCFGLLCDSAPLFLALGNHDGESPRGRGSDADSLAVWSALTRKRLFPNPAPDGFYTGNAAAHPRAGALQDYYAWEWGGALFVVLDPFWHSQEQRGRDDNWSRTLGAEQYRWLARTLEGSRAAFKFVFIHHLVGGADSQARGGAEAAPLYEWGGRNADGTEGFSARRPGWPLPVHPLLVTNRVAAVFHGHDHFYARQELDGITYQLVPQPGARASRRPPRAAEYGYRNGDLLGGSGHLRVAVSPERALVEYVLAALSADPAEGQANRRVAHAYELAPRGSAAPSRPSASSVNSVTESPPYCAVSRKRLEGWTAMWQP